MDKARLDNTAHVTIWPADLNNMAPTTGKEGEDPLVAKISTVSSAVYTKIPQIRGKAR